MILPHEYQSAGLHLVHHLDGDTWVGWGDGGELTRRGDAPVPTVRTHLGGCTHPHRLPSKTEAITMRILSFQERNCIALVSGSRQYLSLSCGKDWHCYLAGAGVYPHVE